MNNRNKFRRPMVEYIKERGYSVIGINIRTDFEICVKRREKQIDRTTMKQISNRLDWLNDEICDEVFDVVTTKADDVDELEDIIKERY
jgi:Mg2+ and Co2+ transporter CorA